MSKKQLIIEKALELFAKQGFEATSVQQITDYCGISKGAFYLSFKSKDELILAIIDYFMQQFTADVDFSVRDKEPKDMLYHFYHSIYSNFLKHANVARLLMKEQSHSLNEELLTKMRYYDQITGQTILALVETVYGDSIQHSKYELVYTIKGLINSYGGLIFWDKIRIDVDCLANSLVEKTNILAKNITMPYITEEFREYYHATLSGAPNKESLSQIIETKINELNESLEKDSLVILREQIQKTSYSTAILKGLLKNIDTHPQCRWIAYLLEHYWGFNQ